MALNVQTRSKLVVGDRVQPARAPETPKLNLFANGPMLARVYLDGTPTHPQKALPEVLELVKIALHNLAHSA
jgi:hypothetical protein